MTPQRTDNDDDAILDIIQIGYGPVSQVLALTLARMGWRVGIFERWTRRYPLPRAVCIDHEMFRMLGNLGMRDELPRISHPAPVYRWFNADWKELLNIDWSKEAISGGSEVNFIHQPTLEEALDQKALEHDLVDLNLGWELLESRQTPDYAEALMRNMATDARRTVRAKFIIGVDGANSKVRESIGATHEDLGFEADWLVIDVLPNQGVGLDIPPAAQWCNPERPTTIVPAGIRDGRYYRRWEFMRLPNEVVADLEKDEVAWQFLSPWVSQDQAQMVRNKVYTFRSLIAKGWRDRRVMIAGDAAHVMPPFMGQGMCSGFRDGANLAWKLDMVLSGRADAKLLDSYEPERRPHVEDIVNISMYLGKLICMPDRDLAAERDRSFFEATAPPPPPFPSLVDGIIAKDEAGLIMPPAGQLGPHGMVRHAGAQRLFDEVFGVGFVLLALDEDPLAHVSARQRKLLERLELKVVVLSRPGENEASGHTLDVTGKYRAFMNEHNVDAMITRPDFYLYGGTRRVADVGALIDKLARDLEANGVLHLALP